MQHDRLERAKRNGVKMPDGRRWRWCGHDWVTNRFGESVRVELWVTPCRWCGADFQIKQKLPHGHPDYNFRLATARSTRGFARGANTLKVLSTLSTWFNHMLTPHATFPKPATPYDPVIGERICDKLAAGQSLTAVAKLPGFPSSMTVHRWRKANPDFSARVKAARLAGCFLLADLILDIADDTSRDFTIGGDGRKRFNPEAVQRDKVRVDARKWLLERMLPAVFGKRVAVDHNAGGDIARALLEARTRVAAPPHCRQAITGPAALQTVRTPSAEFGAR